MPKGQNDWAKLKDSPRAHRILRFLKRKPVPDRLEGTTEDEDEVRVVLGSNGKQRTFTDATKVLMKCTTIRAFDASGNAMRELELDPDDPVLAGELELERQRKEARSSAPLEPGTVPLISVDVPRLVDNIASNLRDVAAAAASQQSTAFNAGFQAMVSVVNLCLTLLVRVEQRVQDAEDDAREAREAAAAAALTQGEQPGADRNAMAMNALQQVLGGKAGGVPIDPSQIAAFMRHMSSITSAGVGGDSANGAHNGS